MKQEVFSLVAKTITGLEEVLQEEINEIGASKIEISKRAVSFEGDLSIIYKANYYCRTAISILVKEFSFEFYSQNEFYDKIYNYNWDKYFEFNTTFSVDTNIVSELFSNTHYAALLCKDAIVDYFRNKYNQRPNVDRYSPDLKIEIFVRNNSCIVFFNSSGEPLFKRGYRLATGIAPINEVLAAGIIKISKWKGDCNFYAPMCGSGTFAIEAAMLSSKIPSGYYRNNFGFMKWLNYDDKLWQNIQNEYNNEICDNEIDIIASDIDTKMVKIAFENAKAAKLHKDIQFIESSFEDFNFQDYPKGIIIFNPPYGTRLDVEDIENNYVSIGNTMKRNCTNHSVWIIGGDNNLHKLVGLRPSKKITMFNGSIECKLLNFEIYEGKKNNYQEY